MSDEKNKLFSDMRARTQENIVRQKAVIAPEVPTDEGTLEDRLRSAASSDLGLSKYHYELLLEAATELQKARMEVIDWMDANHVGLGMFDQTVFNAREHFAGGAS